MLRSIRIRRSRLLAGSVFFCLLLLLAVYLLVIWPFWGMPFNHQRHGLPPITPPWALECWIWEDDCNTAAAAMELVDGYRQHDFPVRTLLIDSPWSTRYNDFQVDRNRYPDPAAFFGTLQQQGIRVVLWMTSMVDSSSKDTAITQSQDWFESARDRGFLAGGKEPVAWWKGKGGFIDYTNAEAVTWWHGLQQPLFDWGIDGWKLDGTCTYFATWLGRMPIPYRWTQGGLMSTRSYMDRYYREEYRFGVSRNPEFVTLARSIDSPLPNAHPEGFAPIDAAPVAWVGDNQHTWGDADRGLQRAISCILKSAQLGYSVIGSDIAGYQGAEPIPADLYIRWAQFSTFCGLFLNGGHGERRLWLRSPEELDIVRRYSWLHTELVPYLYSYVVAAHHGAKPMMRPDRQHPYSFYLGDDLYVAPIYRPVNEWKVTLPPGRWRYWFDDGDVIVGPREVTRSFPLADYPVFIRDGAIIPMNICRSYTGIGDRDWDGYLALIIYPWQQSRLILPHTDGSGSMTVSSDAGQKLSIEFQGTVKPHILRLFRRTKPDAVLCDGVPLRENVSWRFREEQNRLLIRQSDARVRRYEIR